MRNDGPLRRDVLQNLATLPLAALLAQANEVAAQPAGRPVKVDASGLVAKIRFEAPLAGRSASAGWSSVCSAAGASDSIEDSCGESDSIAALSFTRCPGVNPSSLRLSSVKRGKTSKSVSLSASNCAYWSRPSRPSHWARSRQA